LCQNYASDASPPISVLKVVVRSHTLHCAADEKQSNRVEVVTGAEYKPRPRRQRKSNAQTAQATTPVHHEIVMQQHVAEGNIGQLADQLQTGFMFKTSVSKKSFE
jgi:hypothetical protein